MKGCNNAFTIAAFWDTLYFHVQMYKMRKDKQIMGHPVLSCANVQNERGQKNPVEPLRFWRNICGVDRKSLTRKRPLLLQLGCKYGLKLQPHQINIFFSSEFYTEKYYLELQEEWCIIAHARLLEMGSSNCPPLKSPTSSSNSRPFNSPMQG